MLTIYIQFIYNKVEFNHKPLFIGLQKRINTFIIDVIDIKDILSYIVS